MIFRSTKVLVVQLKSSGGSQPFSMLQWRTAFPEGNKALIVNDVLNLLGKSSQISKILDCQISYIFKFLRATQIFHFPNWDSCLKKIRLLLFMNRSPQALEKSQASFKIYLTALSLTALMFSNEFSNLFIPNMGKTVHFLNISENISLLRFLCNSLYRKTSPINAVFMSKHAGVFARCTR